MGDALMSRGTIKLPEDKWEYHNQRRKEMGLSWEEYVDGQAPELDVGIDADDVRTIVRDELERALPDHLQTP